MITLIAVLAGVVLYVARDSISFFWGGCSVIASTTVGHS
jgi:hypothetical protein